MSRLPTATLQCIGPVTCLVVLGIELDSIDQSACLPAEKLANLQELIQSWRSRRWCTRRQLESLIGHLHHAAKVVWPGRTFLRRMIDLLYCFRARDHPIRLNSEFQLDIQWWHKFLASWHGVSFWLFPGMSAPTDVEATSDAAGSLGFGAYFNTEWFSGAWAPSQADLSIAYKELFPVVVASHVWGSQWFRRHVLFRSDNEAVVHILLSRTSKVPCIMRLLRLLLLQLPSLILLLPLNIFLTFITTLLMLFPAFIGRISGVWPPGRSPTLFQSLISSGSSWSLLFRGAVPQLSGARVGSVYAQLLSVWPEEIFRILHTAWQNSPVWLPLPCRWVDIVPVCDPSGLFGPTLNHQGLLVGSSRPAYWARFFWSSCGLSAAATSTDRNQKNPGRFIIFTFTHYRWHHDGNLSSFGLNSPGPLYVLGGVQFSLLRFSPLSRVYGP